MAVVEVMKEKLARYNYEFDENNINQQAESILCPTHRQKRMSRKMSNVIGRITVFKYFSSSDVVNVISSS